MQCKFCAMQCSVQCRFCNAYQEFKDKILALKKDIIKVIDNNIRWSKIECNLLILKIVQNVSNISENVSKQINSLKNDNCEKNHPGENTSTAPPPSQIWIALYRERLYNRERQELPLKVGWKVKVERLRRNLTFL